MRGLVFLALWLIASTAFAQFEYAQDAPANLGQAIGVGADKAVTVHTDEFIAEVRALIEAEENAKAENGRLGRPPVTSAAIGLAVLSVDRKQLMKRLEAEQEEVRRLTGENESLRAQLRSTKQPEPEAAKPTIYLLSLPTCEPCRVAEAYHRPRYEAAGWDFKKQTALAGTVPRYRVCVGSFCEEFRCELMELDARIDGILKRLKTPTR